MKSKSLLLMAIAVLFVCGMLIDDVWAQRGQGRGRGPRPGRGPGSGAGHMQEGNRGPSEGRGPGHDSRHDEDHEVFQFLLEHHGSIERQVRLLPDGVETLTESDDPEVAAKIKEHVHWMQHRIENTNPIRMRDPLFAELFQHTDKIRMQHEETDKGVKVTETSDDPKVAKLIQAHAEVVSKFVEHGFREAMKNHAVPDAEDPGSESKNEKSSRFEKSFPAVGGYGAVVRLPNAAQQPREGTKLVIDVTQGGKPDEVLPALKKIAKYVNIYAGAGKQKAAAQFAIVFHGDATLAVLEPDAYAKEFKVDTNPSLPLLRSLHEAGVEMFVCGQTLVSKGKAPNEVTVFIDTAVSAMTAVVNLQSDGYSYVPLLK